MSMSGFVYWIHKKEHTDIYTEGYVGITNNVEKRWSSHKTSGRCLHLTNAIEKYGADNLVWEVVFTGDYIDCELKENHYGPSFDIGWNILIGGGNSKASVGRTLPENHRKNISLGNTGKVLSEETKQKISEANTGNVMSEEARKKMSASKLGKPMSEDTKAKIAHANKGKTHGVKNLRPPTGKPVKCVETGVVYGSAKEAAEQLNINHSNITQTCKGTRKTAGGFAWKYL